jgi:hypothetical protein
MDEITMRNFVYNYTPRIWREKIGRADFVPYWSQGEFFIMRKGIFPDDIKWYFKEAIKEYGGATMTYTMTDDRRKEK